jgi:hypothetical protein
MGIPLIPAWLEQVLGVCLALLVLLDVFLTVLYARIGAGILSYRIARAIWLILRGPPRFGPRRGALLSFCGPTILVMVVGFWALALTCGMALIIHPRLGTSVTSISGRTPTDFISALYAGGISMAIVGDSTFEPQTSGFRLLYLLNSLIGISMLSLTLMYLMQVYNALYLRNAFAFKVHLASAETGDAAELIAGLAPEGKFDGGYATLSQLGAEMTGIKESHHFYPVLFYFRFRDPAYSVSRTALVLFDTVTLIKSGLDDVRYAWIKESAALAQLWRASMILVTRLAEAFIPGDLPDPSKQPNEETRERWRRRYFAGLRRLREAGLQTVMDEQSGAELYLTLRARWDGHIKALAPALAYGIEEVDPAGCYPESIEQRPEFRARLRSPG